MLTTEDLSAIKQLIQTETRAIVQTETLKIVQTETLKIVQSETRDIIRQELEPVKKDISYVTDRMEELERRVTRMHKGLKREIKMVSHFLDKENMRTLQRVKLIENHLGITN